MTQRAASSASSSSSSSSSAGSAGSANPAGLSKFIRRVHSLFCAQAELHHATTPGTLSPTRSEPMAAFFPTAAASQTSVLLWGDWSAFPDSLAPPASALMSEPFYPRPVPKLADKRILFLSAQKDSVAAVTEEGALLVAGRNEKGQLSPVAARQPGGDFLQSLTRPEEFENAHVRSIATGEEHSLVLLTSGCVIAQGVNEFGQFGAGNPSLDINQQVFKPKFRVVQVACGDYHTLFLARSGELFSCGSGEAEAEAGAESAGEAGGESRGTEPRAVSALIGLPMLQCAAAATHSLALTVCGRVYSWGRNKRGALGLAPEQLTDFGTAVPLLVRGLPRVESIATGRSHSVVIAARGSVHACGCNSHGQLAVDPALSSDSMVMLRSSLPASPRPRQVACGARHTVLLTADGRVWSFGSNTAGQLGNAGGSTHVPVALRVAAAPQLFFYAAAAAGDRTIAAAVRPLPAALASPPSIVGKYQAGGKARLLPEEAVSGAAALAALDDADEEEDEEEAADTYARKAAQIARAASALPLNKDNYHAEAPSGLSVLEAQALIKTAVLGESHSQIALNLLKNRIGQVFADPARVNCSFLLPGVRTVLDSGGVDLVWNAVTEKLPRREVQSIMRISRLSAEVAASKMLQVAHRFPLHEESQLRYLYIFFQSAFMAEICPETIQIASSLFSTVLALPPRGRSTLVQIGRHHYTTASFRTVVRHVKLYLDYFLDNSRMSFHRGILFLQLLYLANLLSIVDQRRRAADLLGRGEIQGIIPLEEFCIDLQDDKHIQKLLDELRGGVVSDFPPREGPGESRITPATLAYFAADFSSKQFEALEDCADTDSDFIKDLNGISAALSAMPLPVFAPADALVVKRFTDKRALHLARPHLLSLETKMWLFIFEKHERRRKCGFPFPLCVPVLMLPVRRETLVENALAQLAGCSDRTLAKNLKVHFVGEEGIDQGGVSREFFDLVVERVFSPDFGVFTQENEGRVVWFRRNFADPDTQVELIGTLLGLGVYNNMLLNLHFPRAFYKKLQCEALDLDDLAEVFPEVAKSMISILLWKDEEEFQEVFGYMDFSVDHEAFGEVKNVELCPNGRNKALTYKNRQEYVLAYSNYLLTDSVAKLFEPFKTGFLRLIVPYCLRLCSAEDLQYVICGKRELDFRALRSVTSYEGYDPSEPYIEDFWRIVTDEFSEAQKRQFLRFTTGTDNVPVGGLKELKFKLHRNGAEPTDRLPTAFTCFTVLLLPRYSDADKLRRLLLLALENAQGFGLE